MHKNQGCGSGTGSGSVLDPYSIGSVDPDPDPYSESGSGSRRAKMTHKSRKKLVKVHVLKCWMASFRAEDFFYNLDILYGGLGIGKLQFLIKKKKISVVIFFSIFGHLSPWIRIGFGSGSVLASNIKLRIRIRKK
jgi:hypothetical protein